MDSSSTSNQTSSPLRGKFNEYLSRIQFSEDNQEAYHALNYALSTKGKKIRPMLLLQTNHLFGGDLEKALPVALAVELFHRFTLVHDDIMDKSPIRRGIPAVHKKFGLGTAINTGDLLMILSYRYITLVNTSIFLHMLSLFNKTIVKIIEGQTLDLEFEKMKEVGMDEYLNMIELKTAIFFAFCAKAGALLAGASSEDQETIYDFGKNIGLCFQIQDDWLDAYGKNKTGKIRGGDIIQNKMTYLNIKAWQLSDRNQRKELIRVRKLHDPQEKVQNTLKIYHDLKIEQNAKMIMNRYYEKALEKLESIHFESETKQELTMLIQEIYERDY
jgi:geranylgeranyl diphosphate synthase type II